VKEQTQGAAGAHSQEDADPRRPQVQFMHDDTSSRPRRDQIGNKTRANARLKPGSARSAAIWANHGLEGPEHLLESEYMT
jgi:hypothetical protein